MSRYRLSIAMCLALSSSFPSAAATVFWPFGFHFPDRALHHAGGFSATAQPGSPAVASDTPVSLAIDLQIALMDIELKGAHDVTDLHNADAVGSSLTDAPAGGRGSGS